MVLQLSLSASKWPKTSDFVKGVIAVENWNIDIKHYRIGKWFALESPVSKYSIDRFSASRGNYNSPANQESPPRTISSSPPSRGVLHISDGFS